MKELNINVGTTVICGDWHQNMQYVTLLLDELGYYGTTTIIHVGDIGFMGRYRDRYINKLDELLTSKGILLYFIEGNHEDYDWLSQLPQDELGLGHVTDRIKHIPRGSQYRIKNKIITFIGGGVSVDQNIRVKGLDWWPDEELTDEQVSQYKQIAPTDILISHDGPSSCTLPLPHTHYFLPELIHKSDVHRNKLEEIREALQPSYMVFGHYHIAHSRVIELDGKSVYFKALDCDSYELVPGKQYIRMDDLYK